MFRIMRGEPKDDIAREQLEVQREIARNTRDFGEDLEFDVVELAPAAGG
jgi:BMFP domain-containing protein YqiC